jgi:hypothetical protein
MPLKCPNKKFDELGKIILPFGNAPVSMRPVGTAREHVGIKAC